MATVSLTPSPFGLKTPTALPSGLIALTLTPVVSTTIVPPPVAVPFCQGSVPRAVHAYEPSTTATPSTRPSQVTLNVLP